MNKDDVLSFLDTAAALSFLFNDSHSFAVIVVAVKELGLWPDDYDEHVAKLREECRQRANWMADQLETQEDWEEAVREKADHWAECHGR